MAIAEYRQVADPPSRSRSNDADKDIAALPLLRHDFHGEWDQLDPGTGPTRHHGWSLFLRGT
ncbi:MAG: hypothetical protein ACYDDW_10975 [Dermatophilaceae bacterium]